LYVHYFQVNFELLKCFFRRLCLSVTVSKCLHLRAISCFERNFSFFSWFASHHKNSV